MTTVLSRVKTAWIVSTSEEVRRARADASAGTRLLCTSEAAYREAAGFSDAVRLDEREMASRYSTINRWAYDQLLELIEKHRSDRAAYFFLQAYFYDLKTFFSRTVKFTLALEAALEGIGEIQYTGPPQGLSLYFLNFLRPKRGYGIRACRFLRRLFRQKIRS